MESEEMRVRQETRAAAEKMQMDALMDALMEMNRTERRQFLKCFGVKIPGLTKPFVRS